MRHTLIILFMLPAAACTSVEPLRPDMHARPVPSRADELAMMNGMRSVMMVNGQPLDCLNGKGLKAFRPKFVQGYRDFQESEAEFASCPKFASLESMTEDKRSYAVRTYLDNGFGLVDLYCNRFFMIAAETRQSRQIQRNSGSAFDTLITDVITALGASKAGIGVLNHGFEAFDATYKNIDAAFVVAPDRDDLINLVTSAQDKIRTESYAAKYQTYPAARSAIERYASRCTFDGMRDLVGTAVRNAAKSVKPETPKPEEAGQKPPVPKDKETPKQPATDKDLLGSAVPG